MASQPTNDGEEPFTRTVTQNVQLDYNNGSLHSVRVQCTWEDGVKIEEGATHGTFRNVVDEHEAKVEYTIKGDVAKLTGFYPEGNETGERLYRENLKALRLLPHARHEVAQRVDESVEVEPPTEALNHQLQNGEVRHQ